VRFIEAALGGTLESAEKWIPVESVTVGESVILNDGFHRVASIYSDEADRQLIRLDFSDGLRITVRRNEDEVRVK
jgi:hypothetical protein